MKNELRQLLSECRTLKCIVSDCFVKLDTDEYPEDLLDLDDDLAYVIAELERRSNED